MPIKQACRGCTTEFISKSKKRLCPECMRLVVAGREKDIFLIERLRAEYNQKYGFRFEYGGFVNYIKSIERKAFCK